MGRDFYAILGVPRDADQSSIKKAYRQQAMRWHPDKNPDNQEEAQKMFHDISDAYQTLSDPEKRRLYDQFGEEAASNQGSSGGFSHFVDPNDLFRAFFGGNFMGDNGPGGGFGSFPQFGFTGFNFPFGQDFDDEQDFGFRRFDRRPTGPRSPPPIELSVSCTLEQLFTGCEKKLLVTRTVKGAQEQKEIVVKIPPGSKEGTKIVSTGTGDQNSNGPAGDVIFTIKERSNPIYKRQGDDLVTTEKISLKSALSGFVITRKDLDGTDINFPVNKIVRPGDSFSISDHGWIKSNGKRGDLVVKLEIDFPEELPDEVKEIIKELFPD
ncbi:DnaJ domain containing protein [Trichomonas vaginalis G3]|uniref:DnaJ domain containing protein n=1 Tax=Trichomonas vaginalis (strain ATCC PRA-98 / G3) TaxID=412133 RepID=A2EZ65_TRIV3|nr:protein folding [Trichomonas vaginalis G3]EAY02053.1 DnaJ domain containing protein [Trichomonas vaginalis G3]KAI5514284.1 protein folding [Trichomonas vaginalis G3]|eukprot:XP_001330507.1 DnaJ domain containing protein [Trichomonas vaginalis G3]